MTWLDDARVTRVPELDQDGVKVRHFQIPKKGEPDPEFLRLANLREALRGRALREGVTYTQLLVDGQIWMTDTDVEVEDHLEVLWSLRVKTVERVLIHGLGLGMVLGFALLQDHVKSVEVVEKDERIARIIGPYYEDPRLTIYVDDALKRRWPVGRRWDVVWHDIWRDISVDNLDEMKVLHRRFGHRAAWQGSWSRELIERIRRQEERRYA